MSQGTIDVNALIIGDWSEVGYTYSAVDYYLGNVPEGNVQIGREYYQHRGTQLPRLVDAVFLLSSSMSFSGNLEEVHERNARFALGKDPSTLADYIYVGGTETPQYFTFWARRWRPGDSALVEAKIWKGLVVSEFQMPTGEEAISMPLEI